MKTHGELRLQDDPPRWVVAKTAPHLAIRLKQIFPRIPKAQVEPFDLRNDAQHCADIAWFIQRYPLRMSDADRAALEASAAAFYRQQGEVEELLTGAYVPPEFTLGLREGQVLRVYQRLVSEVLLRGRGTLLLGDDVGLGKTYSAAGFFLRPGTLPAAVVVQTHLQDQWAEKLSEFTTLRLHKIKGTRPYTLPPADVYIFKYSQISGWVDYIHSNTPFITVAFDEVQDLRTGTASNKGRAARELSLAAKYRLGLSATPIYNYGGEIWNIYDCMACDVLGSWGDFQREWISQGKVLKDPEALGTYLRDQQVFLRRTKKEVGKELPPVNKIVEAVDCDSKAMEDIRLLARQLAMATRTGSFVERGQAGRELDLLVRQATGIGKAKAVAAYVRILLSNGIPVQLMGWHRAVYAIWLKELADFKPSMYTGSESTSQKNESKRRFLAGETNLFIMSLRSGAGLDGLQLRCSTVVFGELDWSPKVHDQVIGRLDREGQTEHVTAIYLNSLDGSDPPMVEMLGLKASQAHAVVDPGLAVPAVHSDDSRIRLLAQRFLDDAEGRSAPPAPTAVAA